MEIIEQSRIQRRFSQAADSYDTHAQAQQLIARHLVDLVGQFSSYQLDRILEIGCGSGGFTRLLKEKCPQSEWVLNDLCENWKASLSRIFPDASPQFLWGNAETLSFPGSFDLIASASALQWMQDLPLFLHRVSAHLAPRGLLAFNTFLPNNLKEIRELTGEGLSYPKAEQLCEWLSSDYEVLHEESARIALYFQDPIDVLKHLKYTGVTANARSPWSRGRQVRFCQAYRERFATPDGKGVTLTYSPLYFIALKKSIV